jgi:hypothetical protein
MPYDDHNLNHYYDNNHDDLHYYNDLHYNNDLYNHHDHNNFFIYYDNNSLMWSNTMPISWPLLL